MAYKREGHPSRADDHGRILAKTTKRHPELSLVSSESES